MDIPFSHKMIVQNNIFHHYHKKYTITSQICFLLSRKILTLRKINKTNNMTISEDDFFIPENTIKSVTKKNYSKINDIINTIEAFVRCTNKSVFIVDYYQKKVIYASSGMEMLLGKSAEEITKAGHQLYMELIPYDDLKTILEINRQGLIKLNEIPVSEKHYYSLSYDFHMICNGKERLINQQLTPLVLNKKGYIWLALCTISLSSCKKAGNGILRKTGMRDFWAYDLKEQNWKFCKEFKLSDIEKEILRLSVQGLKVDEIAARFGKQRDHIKNYKRILFKKLNVHNISEAITYTTNSHLLNF